MNEERTIRYVTPPSFFYGSLLLGVWFSDPIRFEHLAKGDFLHFAAIVAASLFPLGFLVAGISTFLLWLLFALTRHSYEIALSDMAWDRVWSAFDFHISPARSTLNKLIAAQTFDHEMLPEPTHAGAARLWSAFNIAAHSATAIVVSLPIGHYVLFIEWSWMWICSAAVLMLLLAGIAARTWRRHMAFLEFQAHRCWPKAK